MLKNILIGIFAAVLVVAIGTAAYNVIGVNAAGGIPALTAGNGQGNGPVGERGTGGNIQGGAAGAGNGNGTGTSVLSIPTSDLNADEAAALLYMREEEKLARDVYNMLYATWNAPTFQNIAASEQKHMNEIALLLTRYNLTDPAQAPGVFSDAKLQDLYNALVAQGNQSLEAALKVGGAIEEIDILDLQTRLSQTDNADIQQVYNNLMSGSYSHLKAFTGVYSTQTGTEYVPQYMSVDMYQTILNSANSNGNGSGQGNGGQGGQGQGGQGQGGSRNGASNGSGVPQANIAAASTIQGTVSAYNYGTLTIQMADGQVLGVQLGNQNYATSLGFAPQVGAGVTIYGFPGDQGMFTAITVTLDNGQVYTFREATGRPAWAGSGNGKGGGNH